MGVGQTPEKEQPTPATLPSLPGASTGRHVDRRSPGLDYAPPMEDGVDLVLRGGSVFTGDAARPWAEALAIGGGRLLAVGSNAELGRLAASTSAVVELQGQTVLPGFHDAHLHLVDAGLASAHCSLYDLPTPRSQLEAVRAYARSNPDAAWIEGGGWSMDDYPGGRPGRELLDDVVADRPVYLDTRDGHTAWVNTKALELAGIDASTSDPPGGRIDRDETGTPTGTLQESAMSLVAALLPEPTVSEWAAGILRAQAELHGLGITTVQEARLAEAHVRAYRQLAERELLTLKVEGNLHWTPEGGEDQLDRLLELRALGCHGRLRLRGAKLFQDGVVENHTAAMLEPYLDAHGSATAETGISMFEPRTLDHVVALLDGHGFQVHIHTIGDRAVREALDAIERAQDANGRRDARHHLAHLQFVHAHDIPRFAELGVGANVSPYWAVRSGYVEELTLPFVSARAGGAMYPFGSLLRAGAVVAGGSDWMVSTANPLEEIAVAVDRALAEGVPPFLPEECLSLEQALRAFTWGGAWVSHLESKTGTLSPGRLADVVVLDRDLFDRGAGRIAESRVRMTIAEGAVVYEA